MSYVIVNIVIHDILITVMKVSIFGVGLNPMFLSVSTNQFVNAPISFKRQCTAFPFPKALQHHDQGTPWARCVWREGGGSVSAAVDVDVEGGV